MIHALVVAFGGASTGTHTPHPILASLKTVELGKFTASYLLCFKYTGRIQQFERQWPPMCQCVTNSEHSLIDGSLIGEGHR